MRWVYLGWTILLLGLTACEPPNRNLEAEDEQNPYFKKAIQAIEARDYLAAVRSYEGALQANPNVARAHYELGLIYSEKLGDQISALYHFRRYLAMRPDSPIRDTVQARIDSAKIGFAASLPNSPVQNAEVLQKLQADNDQLRQSLEAAQKRVADLEKTSAGASAASSTTANVSPSGTVPTPAPLPTPGTQTNLKPTPSVMAKAVTPKPTEMTETSSAASPKPAAKAGEPKNYTIQAGDSLWKIASKFYPKETKQGVEKIKTANPALSDPRKLKPGTVITIP